MPNYINQGEPIFGSDVDNKFPVMSEDISEAAKCIALSRYTAAVFHLSRAMEAAVVRLGEALSVTVLDKNNVELEWGKIISNLSSPIEKRSVVIRICLAHPHQNGVA
jgi:hypothetical protein